MGITDWERPGSCRARKEKKGPISPEVKTTRLQQGPDCHGEIGSRESDRDETRMTDGSTPFLNSRLEPFLEASRRTRSYTSRASWMAGS